MIAGCFGAWTLNPCPGGVINGYVHPVCSVCFTVGSIRASRRLIAIEKKYGRKHSKFLRRTFFRPPTEHSFFCKVEKQMSSAAGDAQKPDSGAVPRFLTRPCRATHLLHNVLFDLVECQDFSCTHKENPTALHTPGRLRAAIANYFGNPSKTDSVGVRELSKQLAPIASNHTCTAQQPNNMKLLLESQPQPTQKQNLLIFFGHFESA